MQLLFTPSVTASPCQLPQEGAFKETEQKLTVLSLTRSVEASLLREGDQPKAGGRSVPARGGLPAYLAPPNTARFCQTYSTMEYSVSAAAASVSSSPINGTGSITVSHSTRIICNTVLILPLMPAAMT